MQMRVAVANELGCDARKMMLNCCQIVAQVINCCHIKEKGKDKESIHKESIQSSTMPDPGHNIGK